MNKWVAPSRTSLMVCLAATCFSAPAIGQPLVHPAPVTDVVPRPAHLNGEGGDALRIEVIAETHHELQLAIALGERPYVLHMWPHSARAEDFRLLVDGPAGLTVVDPPASRTYRGIVLRTGGGKVPGSQVAGSWAEGRLTAMIDLNDGLLWYVQPLPGVSTPPGKADHLIHQATAFTPGAWQCGVKDVAPRQPAGHDLSDGTGPSHRGSGLVVADIAFDADVQFFQQNAGSIPDTLLDIESIINAAALAYERDVGISYEVTAIVVRTSEASNPYTTDNANALLTEFANEWNANLSDVRRDLAHLMTGRDLGGPTVGIAGGPICIVGSAYALSQSRFTTSFNLRVALTAHEIGHNWSATHCDAQGINCHIMCGNLGGCGGIGNPPFFGPIAINEIVSFKDSRTCLDDLANANVPPFFDTFPSTTLDTAKWSYNNGGAITPDAINEPSGALSLNLSASGTGPFGNDETRSNFILLDGSADVELSYYTQHRGVEVGEELVVEYWSTNLLWIEINRVTSDGVDQPAFSFHTHLLPPDAYHDRFRLRLRAEVSDETDDWYIDDVRLTGCPCPADLDNDGRRNGNDIQGFLDCVIGPGQNCACGDLNRDGRLDMADVLMFVNDLLSATTCP